MVVSSPNWPTEFPYIACRRLHGVANKAQRSKFAID